MYSRGRGQLNRASVDEVVKSRPWYNATAGSGGYEVYPDGLGRSVCAALSMSSGANGLEHSGSSRESDSKCSRAELREPGEESRTSNDTIKSPADHDIANDKTSSIREFNSPMMTDSRSTTSESTSLRKSMDNYLDISKNNIEPSRNTWSIPTSQDRTSKENPSRVIHRTSSPGGKYPFTTAFHDEATHPILSYAVSATPPYPQKRTAIHKQPVLHYEFTCLKSFKRDEYNSHAMFHRILMQFSGFRD